MDPVVATTTPRCPGKKTKAWELQLGAKRKDATRERILEHLYTYEEQFMITVMRESLVLDDNTHKAHVEVGAAEGAQQVKGLGLLRRSAQRQLTTQSIAQAQTHARWPGAQKAGVTLVVQPPKVFAGKLTVQRQNGDAAAASGRKESESVTGGARGGRLATRELVDPRLTRSSEVERRVRDLEQSSSEASLSILAGRRARAERYSVSQRRPVLRRKPQPTEMTEWGHHVGEYVGTLHVGMTAIFCGAHATHAEATLAVQHVGAWLVTIAAAGRSGSTDLPPPLLLVPQATSDRVFALADQEAGLLLLTPPVRLLAVRNRLEAQPLLQARSSPRWAGAAQQGVAKHSTERLWFGTLHVGCTQKAELAAMTPNQLRLCAGSAGASDSEIAAVEAECAQESKSVLKTALIALVQDTESKSAWAVCCGAHRVKQDAAHLIVDVAKWLGQVGWPGLHRLSRDGLWPPPPWPLKNVAAETTDTDEARIISPITQTLADATIAPRWSGAAKQGVVLVPAALQCSCAVCRELLAKQHAGKKLNGMERHTLRAHANAPTGVSTVKRCEPSRFEVL
eukprot:SAG11_NODE_1244_length_5405_cov_15.009994_1_plen_566_part_00